MAPSPAPVPSSDAAPRRRMPRAERRRQLLDVARGVFATHGFAGTAMDVVAEHAGVSKPVLYQHFPSKRDLYLELVDAEGARLLASFRAAQAASDENIVRAREMVHAVFRFMDSPDGAHRLLLDSGAEQDPEIRAALGRARAALAEEVHHLIAAETTLAPAEAAIVAQATVDAVMGGARHWAEDLDPETRPGVEQAAAVLNRVLWTGVDSLPDHEDDKGYAAG